jgi:hypothetical protein
MALSLLSTPESMATPCSVNAKGIYRVPPHFDMPIWHLKSSSPDLDSSNIKSTGNLSSFLLTALFTERSRRHKVLQDPGRA